jgi:hypothetical protein
MADSSKTRPSDATRAEEARDAQVRAGADDVDPSAPAPDDDAAVDPDVSEHYEDMIERGATQQGEGRLP